MFIENHKLTLYTSCLSRITNLLYTHHVYRESQTYFIHIMFIENHKLTLYTSCLSRNTNLLYTHHVYREWHQSRCRDH